MKDFIANNYESLATTLLTIILTINVIFNKINYKGVRNMKLKNKVEELYLYELTEAEIKHIENLRKENKTKTDEKEINEIKLTAKALTEEVIRNYNIAKNAINFLKKFKDKYEFDEHIEKELNKDNE